MSSEAHVTRRLERRIDLSTSRDNVSAAEPWPTGDAIVELDLGDELSLFTRADELDAQVDNGSAQRDGASAVRLRSRAPSQRGAGDLVIRALKVVGLDVDDWLGPAKALAANLIAREVARRIDQRPVEGRSVAGLWRCGDNSPYASQDVSARASGAALVLLHGFFSNSIGSFGGLWSNSGRPTWQLLRRHYGESIFGFDHASLGESPVRNALQLVQALPDNQELHLLAYSRGGLIGELLSRAQATQGISEVELTRLARTHDDDARELREVIRIARDKRLRITRFVRVASPVRGTWLASNRLDRWLSIFYNVARHAIPSGAQQIADHVFDVLAAVIAKRLQREYFPGVDAMRPDGALMALLNDTPPELEQRLTVVGGDCVGHGILNRLKVLITDGFFGEPHDLVVPTASMFGGAPRRGGLRYFFHQTARVDHFHYFAQTESLERVRTGLIGEEDEYQRLQLLERLSTRPVLSANRAIRPDAPLNIVLPGIMGSGLAYKQNDRLWVDFGEFALGNFSRLRLSAAEQQQPYPQPGTAAVYPYESLDFWPVNFYGDLLQALSRRGELVLAQGYDWRKPIALAADALAAKLAEIWPEGSPRPLRLVAHSMGGLVARLLFARHPALRARFVASPHNRLLMLGTPNGGSLAIVRTVLGDNDLIDKLDCIAPESETELLSVAGTFPGFFELLPQTGRDWSKQATWDQLFTLRAVKPAKRPTLDAAAMALAARGRAELQAALPALPLTHSIYVAGFVDAAAPDATIVDLDSAGGYVRGAGDGTVSYTSGLIDGMQTYYVNAAHGDLAAHKSAFPAYFDLLDRGETSALPRRWQDLRDTRGGVFLSAFTRSELAYRPSRGEIYRALLGMSPRQDEQPLASHVHPIALRVVHGGLRFARHPLVVGHYQGDTMRGSEAELDRLYGGQLRTALELGVYPGAVESFEIFKRKQDAPDRRSPFAIIVGLGRPGELSVGELRRTVRRGILGWFGTATSAVPTEHRRGAFSLVLLGSSVSGMTVVECARAILQGAQDANSVLTERPRPQDPAELPASISELELIEIYEDKALELANELPRLVESSEFRHRFKSPIVALERRTDALTRLRDSTRSVATVRRLDIRALSGGRLRYALPGIQAAVPLLKRNIDIEEIRTYAREIDRHLSTDPTLGRVLFHQLLPLELKHFALEQYDLLLTLNQSAASIPWELADAGGELPLSVQSGMIRQLRSSRYAARERVSQNTALVVGEPQVDGLPPLPGARREAELVAESLRTAGFAVEYLDRPSALEVRDALGRHPYRIIHFAGHGVVDYQSPLAESNAPARTGMVIGSLPVSRTSTAGAGSSRTRGDSNERGKAAADTQATERHWVLLTPEDVRECVAQVPELVFINCCHLGRQAGVALDAPRLASNLANAFMDIGCRAVVAAGWAVEDNAAQCFAEEFYGALVGRGAVYIEAVRRARAAAHSQFGRHSPTWGAYQCYGDVRYGALRGEPDRDACHFVTTREFACWLNCLAVEAKGADKAKTQQLLTRLSNQLQQRQAWLTDEHTCVAAVDALESVGAYAQALALIEARCGARRALPPALWRAHARLALRASSADFANADRAMRKLEHFAQLECSAASWFALGTYCRRWFLLRRGQPPLQIDALKQLVNAMFHGLDSALQSLGDRSALQRLSVEHAQKVLGAMIIADSLSKANLVGELRKLYEERELSYRTMVELCESRLRERADASEFWDDVDTADLRLLLLASPRQTRFAAAAAYRDEAVAIAAEYRVAIQISATTAERDSIETYIRFWHELAALCLSEHGSLAPQHRQHWTWLHQAIGDAGMPGIDPDAPRAAAQPSAVPGAASKPRRAASPRSKPAPAPAPAKKVPPRKRR